MGDLHGVIPSGGNGDAGKDVVAKPDPAGSPSLFVFKTVSESHVGELSYFRVCTGTITAGMDLVNEANGKPERLAQIFVMSGKDRKEIAALRRRGYRCGREAERHAHEQHPEQQGVSDRLSSHQVPRSRLSLGDHPEVEGGRGQDLDRTALAAPGRSDVPVPRRSRAASDGDQRAGRAASRRHRAPAEAALQRRRRHGRAEGAVPGDHQGHREGRRVQAQEADGRPRAVRPRAPPPRAHEARAGIRVPGRDRRRRRAEELHSGGGEGRGGDA